MVMKKRRPGGCARICPRPQSRMRTELVLEADPSPRPTPTPGLHLPEKNSRIEGAGWTRTEGNRPADGSEGRLRPGLGDVLHPRINQLATGHRRPKQAPLPLPTAQPSCVAPAAPTPPSCPLLFACDRLSLPKGPALPLSNLSGCPSLT
jgi:hypothetical protein